MQDKKLCGILICIGDNIIKGSEDKLIFKKLDFIGLLEENFCLFGFFI